MVSLAAQTTMSNDVHLHAGCVNVEIFGCIWIYLQLTFSWIRHKNKKCGGELGFMAFMFWWHFLCNKSHEYILLILGDRNVFQVQKFIPRNKCNGKKTIIIEEDRRAYVWEESYRKAIHTFEKPAHGLVETVLFLKE